MWPIEYTRAVENNGDLKFTQHEAVKTGVDDFQFRWSGRKGVP
jgi:hypothetical protein